MTTLIERFDEAQIFIPKLPLSPYPGLRPFQKAEWPVFFGRERMTDEVIGLLMKQKLLVVHGASGNGKSSLIRAGVLARLEQEHARSGVRWRTCAMSPGDNPLINLSKAFAGAAQPSGPNWIEFRRALNHGTQSAKAISRLLALGDGDRLCVLIDQFEEIFQNFGDTRHDQSTLLSEFLVGFSESAPDGLFVLVTMRSEFLGLCTRFAGLTETINRTQYLLPRMDTDGLLRAVREPALLYGGRVAEQLAERLIADARSSQDELPLIQHGLSRLWESAAASAGGGPVLDLPDYIAQGSLSNLISDHADRVADVVGGDTAGKRIVEELFRALTAINSDGHAVRRQQSFAELVAITGTTEDRLRQILEAFRQFGVSFVTPYPPAPIDAETLIDVSHEALIRHWKKIADPETGWLQKEFRDGLLWQALRVQAESFLANPANLLSEATTEARGAWLVGRNEAWARRYGGMWPEVEKLIDASRDEIKRRQEQDKKQKEDAENLRLQLERGARIRVYIWLAIAASIAMMALAGFASYQWRTAVVAKQEEETAKLKAEGQKQIADAERSKAEAARGEAEAARQTAVAEKLKAEDQRRIADAERSKAEITRAEAEAAQQTAVAEKLKAEDQRRIADTERSKAEIARGEAEAAQQAAVAEKLKAEDQKRIADAERSKAEIARAEAEAAQQKAVAEKLKAEEEERKTEAARRAAVAAQSQAETEKRKTEAALKQAMEEKAKADKARQDAEAALQKANDEAQRAEAASNRASKFQDESARSYVLSHGSSRDALARALAALAKEKDPLKIAFFGQVVSLLLMLATDTEIHSAMQILIQSLGQTRDPSLASAVAQALSDLVENLMPDQAQVEASALLKVLPGVVRQEEIQAFALAFGALAPKVSQATSSEMKTFLVRAVKNVKDPAVISTIATALSSLKWTPTVEESEALIIPVLKALSLEKDPDQLGKIATIIVTMAPRLGLQGAQNALDTIRLIGPQFSEILKPASHALAARVDQSSTPISVSLNLLQKISAGRWCTPSARSYSLQLAGNSIVWRDSLGNVDTESIVYNTANEAQTTTQKSFHPNGESEKVGTIWTYRSSGRAVYVTNSAGKKPFALVPC
jgi:hypothetical protein